VKEFKKTLRSSSSKSEDRKNRASFAQSIIWRFRLFSSSSSSSLGGKSRRRRGLKARRREARKVSSSYSCLFFFWRAAEQAAHARRRKSNFFCLFVGPTGSRPLLAAFFGEGGRRCNRFFFLSWRVSFRERGKEEEEEGPRRFIQKLGESSAHQTKNTRERKSSQQKKITQKSLVFISRREITSRGLKHQNLSYYSVSL